MIGCAAFVCAGCVRHTSPAVRAASFRFHQDLQVAGESAYAYILRRTAVVFPEAEIIVSDEKATAESANTTFTITFKSPDSLSLGSAAAIDRRGYFLTAAHCIHGQEPKLAFLRDHEIVVVSAQVVWRGDETKREPDLALLRVPGELLHVFDWSPAWQADEKIMGGGLNLISTRGKLRFEPDCFAGTILEHSEDTIGGLRFMKIHHTAPIHKGDSGGPLVNQDGQLIGVNVSLISRHLGITQLSRALRPDLVWLRQIIDEDANRTLQAGDGKEGSTSPGTLP